MASDVGASLSRAEVPVHVPGRGRGLHASNSLRLLVADNHAVVRAGLRQTLESRANWSVIAEAANGKDAIYRALTETPDVIILEYSLPLLSGIEVTRQLSTRLPSVRIVFFTIHDDDAVFYNAVRSGARGYLLKSDSALELCSAVEAVVSGLTHFTRRSFEQMLGVFLENIPARALSNRELGLVKLIAEGHSNKEIGQVLNLSVKSVEAHCATVMHKLNLTSVAQLVRYAVKSQLIDA